MFLETIDSFVDYLLFLESAISGLFITKILKNGKI